LFVVGDLSRHAINQNRW